MSTLLLQLINMVNIFKLACFVVILAISFYLVSVLDVMFIADQTFFVKLAAAFMAGIFYTSFLTAPLSLIILIALGINTNVYLVTVVSGMGAVVGDLIIVRFFRVIFGGITKITPRGFITKIKLTLKYYHLDILAWIIGSIIVASPFPDELGLILLGASKLSYFKLAILTFILNSLGILIILLTTKAIL